MIYLGGSIRNPLWRSSMNDGFRNYFCWEPSVSDNKFFSFEITRHWYYLFKFDLRLGWTGSDHAGPSLDIELFGYGISISLHDKRHWDHDNDRWATHDDNIENHVQ